MITAARRADHLSNRGGRQLDRTATPLAVLAELVDAVDGTEVLVDGGLRCGADVAAAVARAAVVTRPYLYALMGGGEAGVDHLLHLFRADYERTLRLLGVTSTDELGPDLVRLANLLTSPLAQRCSWPGPPRAPGPRSTGAPPRRKCRRTQQLFAAQDLIGPLAVLCTPGSPHIVIVRRGGRRPCIPWPTHGRDPMDGGGQQGRSHGLRPRSRSRSLSLDGRRAPSARGPRAPGPAGCAPTVP